METPEGYCPPEVDSQAKVLVVFATNPEVDNLRDTDALLGKLDTYLHDNSPGLVIFLGGSSWEGTEGQQVFEGSNLLEIYNQRVTEPLQNAISLNEGQETFSQVDALVNFLETSELDYQRLAMLSTWHQLARAGILVLDKTHKIPELLPIFTHDSINDLTYDLGINFLAGVGYTSLVVLMRKFGLWQDGGPLVRVIENERQKRNNVSWFNTNVWKTRD